MLSCVRPWVAGAWLFGLAALANAADGMDLYVKNCAQCHGPKGQPNEKIAKLIGVKDLTQSRIADAEIEKQIQNGRLNDRNVQVMPPFKEKLKPEEIKALIGVVKQLRK